MSRKKMIWCFLAVTAVLAIVTVYGIYSKNRTEITLTVLSVDTEYDMIHAEGESRLYDSGCEYAIHGASNYLKRTEKLSDIKSGDQIIVVSDGHVLMIYPYQFSKIYSIRIKK